MYIEAKIIPRPEYTRWGAFRNKNIFLVLLPWHQSKLILTTVFSDNESLYFYTQFLKCLKKAIWKSESLELAQTQTQFSHIVL